MGNVPGIQLKQALIPAQGGEFDRSAQIVAAAYDLLETEGIEGLTIRAVLKKTGLARRALYDRFAGKDDLVLAVFEQTIRMAATLYAGQVKSLPDPMDRLRHIVTSVVLGTGSPEYGAQGHSNRRGAALTREHLRLAEARPAELQAAVSPLVELIATQLNEGMQAGQIRQTSAHRLAVLVYNVVSSTVHTELLAEETVQPDPERRKQLAEDIWDFCRRAIAA